VTPLLRRGAFQVWLTVLALAAVLATRAQVAADLSAFLPEAPTPEQRLLIDQLRSGVTSRLLLVGVTGGEAARRAAVSRALAERLRAGGAFEVVHNGDSADLAAGGTLLFDHRYLLSPAVDAQRFTAAGLREGIADTVALLGTPAGALVKPILWRDPTGETVRMAEVMLPAQAPRNEDGVWVSRGAPRALLVLTTRAEGADLDGQAAALAAVEQGFAAAVAATGPADAAPRLEVSGPPLFAVQSRTLIRGEVERLATLGALAIVGLLLVVFGSLRALVVATLPVATGVLVGVAAVSVGFGTVHGLTLGFGTTLIGEAVDYAIYYLIQARPRDHAVAAGWPHWVAHHWPAVRLGLLTSLAGFCALLFSGFGGLRQLGVFSLAGLTAAALTTRHVLPLLAPRGAGAGGLRAPLGRATGALAARLPRLRGALLVLSAAALALLVSLPSAWRGSLATLSTVSPAALVLDATLRDELGAAEAGLLVAVEGADEAGVLVQAEAAGRILDTLVADGRLAGYTSPARLLPSPAAQAARRAALPDAPTLRAALADAVRGGPLPLARLDPFVQDVQAQRSAALLTAADLAGTPLAAALQAQLIRGDAARGRPWVGLINLQLPVAAAGAPAPLDTAALRVALREVPAARVLRVDVELNALYTHYLHEALWQAGLGALGVVLLLAAYLRAPARLARVLLPLAASGVLVLAGLTLAGVALGILHLVGLLLVVAVGSNYALFFDHLRQQGQADEDTLASLLVANSTTVVSFGLLAVSKVAVLAAVGQVVAPGAALALLLSAALIGRRDPGVGRGASAPSVASGGVAT